MITTPTLSGTAGQAPSVLAGGVVTDRVCADDLAFERDVDLVADDRDLDLLTDVRAADAIAGGREADRPGAVDLARDRVTRRRDRMIGTTRFAFAVLAT